MKLHLIDQGVLYCNPHPGHEAVAAIYPCVLPLSYRELICLYRRGQALYSLDGRIFQLRSTDGGKTWDDEGPIFREDPRYTHTVTWVSRLSDGTLVHQGSRYLADRQTMIRFNPVTGGHRPDDQYHAFSADGGRTWSEPRLIELSRQRIVDAHCSIYETPDARWVQLMETWNAWDTTEQLYITNLAIFSDNRGRTWSEPLELPTSRDPRRMYSHAQFIKLRDGRFCASMWTQDIGGQVNHDLHLMFGDPMGREWSEPRPTGLLGQSSRVGEVRPGVLAITYTRREGDHPGIYVALSRDGGASFDVEQQVNVWDSTGRSHLGGVHPARYPASHDNQSFGKPDTAILPSGEIISSWWCTHDSVTQVRFARLRVE